MTSGNSKVSRGKKERFLRYILRRRPCAYILLGNIAIFFLLSTSLGGLFWASMRYSEMANVYLREHDIMEKHWNNSFTFSHCIYKSLNPDWNTSFCADRCGPEAFAFRHYQLDPRVDNEDTCVDRSEMTMCHENLSRLCAKQRSGDDAIRACYGFQNVSMSSYLANQNSDPEATMVNAITNEGLQQYMNQTLLANELLLKCPACRVITAPYYFSDSALDEGDICFRVLKTVKEGWPNVASNCDAVDRVPGYRNDDIVRIRSKRISSTKEAKHVCVAVQSKQT